MSTSTFLWHHANKEKLGNHAFKNTTTRSYRITPSPHSERVIRTMFWPILPHHIFFLERYSICEHWTVAWNLLSTNMENCSNAETNSKIVPPQTEHNNSTTRRLHFQTTFLAFKNNDAQCDFIVCSWNDAFYRDKTGCSTFFSYTSAAYIVECW